LVKPRHEPQIVTNEHRQAMNLIMGSVFITLNLTQNKEQVQKKEQVLLVLFEAFETLTPFYCARSPPLLVFG
jgi:hypothetical protein